MIFGPMKSNPDIEIWDATNNKTLDSSHIYVGISLIIHAIWFWKKMIEWEQDSLYM